MRTVRHALALLLGVLSCPACFGAAVAAPPVAVCTPDAGLAAYAAVTAQHPVLAAAATRFLPDDGRAQLLIKAPSSAVFYVFENRFPAEPLALIAAVPAPKPSADAPTPAFTDSDSELQIKTADQPGFWPSRSFTIIACGDGKPIAWGGVRAPIGDVATAEWICDCLAVATFLFFMLCLRDVRKPGGSRLFSPFEPFRKDDGKKDGEMAAVKPPPASDLADRYPSFFKRQELRGIQVINPIHLTVNEFGVPSVQKFQVVLFSALIVWLLLYLVLLNGTLSSLSFTVVELMGISGAAAAASNGVNQQKTRLSFDNWAWLQANKVMVDINYPHNARWSELLTSQKEFNVYKMQALLFSVVVAVALYIAGSGGDLATFKISDELLGVLGLSQVTYIGGLLVQPPSVQELDKALTKLRTARAKYERCLATGKDLDDKGNFVDVMPPRAAAAPNAWREVQDQIDTIIPMLESTLEVDVNSDSAVLKPSA